MARKITRDKQGHFITIKSQLRDFPGGEVVKNTPSNAGDVGSIPGQGTRFPHAAGQLSPRTATTELVCLNERVHVPQLRPNAAKKKKKKEST